MDWFRLHHGTCTDPKWRIVSKRAGQSTAVVIAVWIAMLERASQNNPRGSIAGWSDEDMASILDLDKTQVQGVREAMQGKTLDGDILTGWDRRQPKREDGSAERARAWRERNRTQQNADRTHENADERTPNARERTRTLDREREEKEEIEEKDTFAVAKVNARELDTISRIETRMEFDGQFWPLCPHQTGKTDAYAEFHVQRQKAALSDICDGMKRYAETLRRPKAPQPMNPANWLQKQRWTDKPMEAPNATDSINPLTHRGAAAWVVAGELTRGAFEQPDEDRPSYRGSYGGAVEAPYIDGTPYPDGST